MFLDLRQQAPAIIKNNNKPRDPPSAIARIRTVLSEIEDPKLFLKKSSYFIILLTKPVKKKKLEGKSRWVRMFYPELVETGLFLNSE